LTLYLTLTQLDWSGHFLPELQSTVLKQLTMMQAGTPPRSSPGKEERLHLRSRNPPPSEERNKSEATEIEESLSVSEGDDYSDSVSSIGGDRGFDQSFDQTISVSLNNSFSENSTGKQTTSSRSRNTRLMMLAGGRGGGSVGGGYGHGNGHGHGRSSSGRSLALNKYKTEIALLQSRLEDAQALDKTMLQGRIREYQ
jgi:hypothetical protein